MCTTYICVVHMYVGTCVCTYLIRVYTIDITALSILFRLTNLKFGLFLVQNSEL